MLGAPRGLSLRVVASQPCSDRIGGFCSSARHQPAVRVDGDEGGLGHRRRRRRVGIAVPERIALCYPRSVADHRAALFIVAAALVIHIRAHA